MSFFVVVVVVFADTIARKVENMNCVFLSFAELDISV